MGNLVHYREINLAQMDEQDFRRALSGIEKLDKPRLCFIDEVDSRASELWPYEALLPSLEPPTNRRTIRTCFVLAGSSGNSLSRMKQRIAQRPKGTDLLSRIPQDNEFVIEGLGLGDRLLVMSTQFLSAAREYGRQIDEVEKLVLYYVALNPQLKSARQIRQLAVRCIERMPSGEERVKFDYLFDAGDPDNKKFWNKTRRQRKEFANTFVRLEDDQAQLKERTGKPETSILDEKRVIDETAYQKNRIAVLPFSNISPDPRDEYFADGMTEELISTISKIGGLQVIARTSVLRYKNASKGIDEIGKELRVGAILEGSVRKAGEKLRITAQLIDSTSSQHLWSESYDRELKDIFAIQSEISQTVADALKIKLLDSERKRIEKKQTESSEAHLLYLKGLDYLLNENTVGGQKKAIGYFEKSIEIDPKYSLALVGMSDGYDNLQYLAEIGETSEIPMKEALSKSEYLANRALEIDPNLAEGHNSLSWVKFRKRDWAGAELEARRALELNPNVRWGRITSGMSLMIRGKPDQAIEELRKALELDPLSPFANYTLAYFLCLARQYDRAEEQARKMLDLDIDKIDAHVVLGRIFYAKSLFKESLAEYQQSLDPSKGKADVHLSEIALCYTKLGKTEEAREILDDLVEISKDQYISANYIFPLYLALDEKDKAFEYLEKIGERDMVYLFIYLKYSSLYDEVRTDPRFIAIFKKLGL